MQNRYTADLGDFGKYGMLRAIFNNSDLKLGVNWYLTSDESHNNDGKYITYLDESKSENIKRFKACDPELYYLMKEIKDIGNRSVSEVEKRPVLPGASFYSGLLDYKGIALDGRQHYRNQWAQKGLDILQDCDVVFFDPDNGLETPSTGKCSDKAVKYVYIDELSKYFSRGQSLIIYNHRCREKREKYEQRFKRLYNAILGSENIFYLSYNRGTTRDFIFVLHPKHRDAILKGVFDLLNSPFKEHFNIYQVE